MSSRGRLRALCLALSVALPVVAAAGTGFVTGTHVVAGNVYSTVTINLRCKVQYFGHEPRGRGDVLRIRLESTGLCNGAAPDIADTREQIRPANADAAGLNSIEYDGHTHGAQHLRLEFSAVVRYDVRLESGGQTVTVRVFQDTGVDSRSADAGVSGASRRVATGTASRSRYVINLESSQTRPDASAVRIADGLDKRELFVTEAMIDGTRWYRLRVGYFATAEEAARTLQSVRAVYPGAWIDRESNSAPTRIAPQSPPVQARADTVQPAGDRETGKVDNLMRDGRRAMTAGELSRAVQIFTKILQLPANDRQRDAQEFLALARERNGQIAHAKAEYERYLATYPDGEGTERVRQRLAALLAAAAPPDARRPSARERPSGSAANAERPWKIRTFLSQYYRRDVNQVNDLDETVSQSSIYTDASIDARRRGDRFDLSTRITAGYRNDLLDDDSGSGNELRISYAYADLIDTKTGLRGRAGRQTRNHGGVLGRFDGLNLAYALTGRVELEGVIGKPVFSTSDDVNEHRTFYGLSARFDTNIENLELRAFALEQDIAGLTDRQSIGGEVRYFGPDRSVWGMLDYDTAFSELSSLFVQASMRMPGDITATGLFDRRRSPYLSLGNALVGQSTDDFETLKSSFTPDELRQIALDRSPQSNTITLGLSRPLTPRLQLGFNATRSDVDATPDSGNVPGNPASNYTYYSADLIASSLLKQGDTSIVTLRRTESSTATIDSISLDSRFPIGRAFRISGRLRVDRRNVTADGSDELIISPRLRLHYRPFRRLRLDLEAGKQFSDREMDIADLERESYFLYLGYQYFY